MKEYKRLTIKCEVGIGLTETSGNIVNDYEKVVNRLAKFEDKIENGTLIELPCKVGDTVWLIYENHVEIAEIWRIVLTPTYNEFKWFIPYDETQPKDTGSFKTNEIGKTVFLTKAEAEAKLKELL